MLSISNLVFCDQLEFNLHSEKCGLHLKKKKSKYDSQGLQDLLLSITPHSSEELEQFAQYFMQKYHMWLVRCR